MNIDLIPIGDNPPESLNVIIEVPVGGEPVKYEFDKKSGALFVDRILHTPMRYPANYGFVSALFEVRSPHPGSWSQLLVLLVFGEFLFVVKRIIPYLPWASLS